MLVEDSKLSGSVEVDETYIGGKRTGKRGRGAEGKSIVAGAVERKGKVSAVKVPNVKGITLRNVIRERVIPSSTIYTDELKSYNGVKKMGYQHKRVHHAAKIYVVGDSHTNTLEGFWSLLKRGVSGVYHAVSDKYLQSYLNEYTFRYNHREDTRPMFKTFLCQVTKG